MKSNLIDQLNQAEYYNNRLNGRLTRLITPPPGIAFSGREVKKAKVEEGLVNASPTARSELRTIDLFTSNDVFLRTLFLQIYWTGMKRLGIFSDDTSVDHGANEFEKIKEMEYRKKHMLFWNEVGLYAPYLLGVEKLVDKSSSEFAVGLITDYWEGATHLLDILAINARQDRISEQMHDEFVLTKPHLVSQLIRENDELDVEKMRIPSSVLRTINDFGVRGTNALKDSTLETKVRNFAQYLNKGIEFFNKAYRWHCTVSKNENAKSAEIARNFRDSLKVLLTRVVNPERFVYSQGDEFLHHFQYVKIIDPTKGEMMVSGVFDADRSSLRAIERGRAKALLAPYLNLSYENYAAFIQEANKDLAERLKDAKNDEAKGRLAYLFDDPTQVMLQHDLWAVYEGLCGIGRAAKDDLNAVDKKRSLLVDNMTVNYKNDLIKFKNPENMPGAVSLGDYSTKRRIAVLTYRLNERIERMLDTNGFYSHLSSTDIELYNSLKNMQDILVAFTIPFAFGQRELPFTGKAS